LVCCIGASVSKEPRFHNANWPLAEPDHSNGSVVGLTYALKWLRERAS
jgi:hypothetical protein